MTHTQDQPNPAWDPVVRHRVQRAVDDLLHTAKDVLMRYSDEDCCYVAPGDINEFGDVTGLMAVSHNQVVSRLQAQIQATLAEFQAVQKEIDAYKRAKYGPGYRPFRRNQGEDQDATR